MIIVPTVMINFKTYNEASGKDAEKLSRTCKKVAKKYDANVIVCAQPADISNCSKKITTFGQHIDVEIAGGHTGKITIKSIQENGATGCLVNHSENRIPYKKIMETIALLSEAGMVSVVCVQDEIEAKKVAKLSPDIIAIEPPELIGGTVSVTKADPTIITKSVEAVHKINKHIPVLCGAGVHTTTDVRKAIKLGTHGVLVASGVTKAKDQEKAVEKLVKGL